MEIRHKDGKTEGAFLALSGESTIGEMTYHMEDAQVMAIEHTEVDPAERGNNVGGQLLDFAADYARKNKLHIRPICKFVNVMFRKEKEKYNDVILKPGL